MSARKFDINHPKLYGNVRVLNDSTVMAVILHRTTVVLFDKANSKVVITSGGWKTPTTKTAINNALGQLSSVLGYNLPQVYQKKGEWFLTNGERFSDNMQLGVSELLTALN